MKHQQGFTICGLMVAIFITTLITIVITDYMMQNTRSSIITSSQQNILKIEQSLDEVATDIRVSANADTNNRNADPTHQPMATSTAGLPAPTPRTCQGCANTWRQHYVLRPAALRDPQDNLIYFVKNGAVPATCRCAHRRKWKPTTCPVNLATSSCPKDRELSTMSLTGG